MQMEDSREGALYKEGLLIVRRLTDRQTDPV